MLGYDLLEWQGEDWRQHPQHARRAQLEQVIDACASPRLMPSPLLTADGLATLRELLP